MANYKQGPQGKVMKVQNKGKQETYTLATDKEIKNMSAAQKINLGTRTKGNNKI